MCGGNTDTTKLPPSTLCASHKCPLSEWFNVATTSKGTKYTDDKDLLSSIQGKSLATWTKKLLLGCACPEHNLPVLKSHARAFPSGPCQSLWSAVGSRPFLLLLLFPLQPNILISPTLHPVNGDEEARSMDAMICYF